MLSIIFPTLNEESNVQPLFEEIAKALEDFEYEIVMVDANSKDRTREVANIMKRQGHPVTIYKSSIKKDLAGDTYYGFQYAKYDLIGVMDSDYQHDPRFYPDLLKIINEEPNVDMVIGSRYAKGGSLGDWALHRKIISKFAVGATKAVTGVSDPITQFYIIRKKVLDVPDIKAVGMRLSLELIAKGNINEIREVPITFRSRGGGESTQSFNRVMTDLKMVGEVGLIKVKRTIIRPSTNSNPNNNSI